jgi:Domain of unknown function (DUF1707)
VSASAASHFPPGDMRVSDADRDWAIGELTEHFQAGRITTDELEERSGLALKARTGKELAALFTDLPARSPQGLPQPAPSADPGPARPGRVPVVFPIAAFTVFMTLLILTYADPQRHFLAGLVPLLAVLLVVRLLARRGFRHQDFHEHRHMHRHMHGEDHDRLQ